MSEHVEGSVSDRVGEGEDRERQAFVRLVRRYRASDVAPSETFAEVMASFDAVCRQRDEYKRACEGMFPVEERRVLEHQVDEARRLLVEMALPYEALLADAPSRRWIAPRVWRAIEDAAKLARAMVAAWVRTPARGADQ